MQPITWEHLQALEPIKAGDAVSYRTKDIHGYIWVNAIVEKLSKDGKRAHLRTEPGNVALLVAIDSLTRIKTVWADTHKPVLPKK